MVDESRSVIANVAVDIIFFIEREKIDMPHAAFTCATHLLFCDRVAVLDRHALADVFDNTRTPRDFPRSIDAASVLGRIADAEGLAIIGNSLFQLPFVLENCWQSVAECLQPHTLPPRQQCPGGKPPVRAPPFDLCVR